MRSKAPGRVKKTGKVMEMASRLFQSIVLQMKDTVDRTDSALLTQAVRS